VTSLAALADWLHRYELAWRANAADPIRDLFTEDAVYRWNPFGRDTDGVIGREAIVASWLATPDDPTTWTIECAPLAVNGDLGVAQCRTHYAATAGRDGERTFHNIWLVRLTDESRCSDFTEIYMRQPAPGPAENGAA
jgi:ketosteroid isomerase-like protein